MKMKVTGFLFLLLSMTLGASLLAAQDNDNSKSKSDTRTVTGCLSQGDSANEYVLTASDGSTWELRSSSVPLANHVGHTVSAVGAVNNPTAHNLKEDAKDAAHDTGMKKDNTEHGHLTVTDVTMVSDSCNK